MPASQGYAGQFGIGTANPVTQRIQYKDETFVKKAQVIDGNQIRGTREKDIALVRDGRQVIDGPVNLVPTAIELSEILPWILGGAPSGSGTVTYPVADALTDRYVTIDRVAQVSTYDHVKVDKATFRAASGGPLEVSLDLVGETETVANSGTFPALSLDRTNGPFILSDLSISVGGTTVKVPEFDLTIDNVLDKDRFFNSNTLTAVNEQDRITRFKTRVPYGDYYALYATLGAAGLAVVMTLTNGGAVLVISLVKVALPQMMAQTPGKKELFLPLEGECFHSGGTNSVVITLNNGP